MAQLQELLLKLDTGKTLASVQAAISKVKEASSDALTELVNLYCETRAELDPQIAALKIQQKELTDIEVELLAAIDEIADGADDGTLKTEIWLMAYGAKGTQFEVTDKQKMIEFLGLETFIAMASVSVTELRKSLTKSQIDQVGKDVYKTKRKLTYAKK